VISYTTLVYRNLLLHIVPDKFISTQNEVFKYGVLRNYLDLRWRPYKSAWWQVSWCVPPPNICGWWNHENTGWTFCRMHGKDDKCSHNSCQKTWWDNTSEKN